MNLTMTGVTMTMNCNHICNWLDSKDPSMLDNYFLNFLKDFFDLPFSSINAFFAWKCLYDKTWGVNTKMTMLLYTSVMRPIITYAAIITKNWSKDFSRSLTKNSKEYLSQCDRSSKIMPNIWPRGYSGLYSGINTHSH